MVVAVAAFSLAAALIVLLPGPDTLVVLRELVRDGRGRAGQTVVGVLCGLAVWVLAAALGLSALLRASHTGYISLKIAGAAYLIWLGVQSLRRRRLASREDRPRRRVLGRGFTAGFATDLLNPKVGVFFVTFLPGFVPGGYSVAGCPCCSARSSSSRRRRTSRCCSWWRPRSRAGWPMRAYAGVWTRRRVPC